MNNIISFEDFLEARNTGINNNAFRLTGDWDNVKGTSNAVLLGSKDGYKVWRGFKSYIFVSDEDLNYLGSMSFDIENNETIWNVRSSDSLMKGGFYKLVYSILFSKFPNIKILSDDALSELAIKSYTKLSKSGDFNVTIFDGTKNIPYDEEILQSEPHYKVMVEK